uniref:Uncharacterized protein n=1 Tax=Ciona intestinalis TaxID=7719 RepID=F7ATC3_CIOIN
MNATSALGIGTDVNTLDTTVARNQNGLPALTTAVTTGVVLFIVVFALLVGAALYFQLRKQREMAAVFSEHADPSVQSKLKHENENNTENTAKLQVQSLYPKLEPQNNVVSGRNVKNDQKC